MRRGWSWPGRDCSPAAATVGRTVAPVATVAQTETAAAAGTRTERADSPPPMAAEDGTQNLRLAASPQSFGGAAMAAATESQEGRGGSD